MESSGSSPRRAYAAHGVDRAAADQACTSPRGAGRGAEGARLCAACLRPRTRWTSRGSASGRRDGSTSSASTPTTAAGSFCPSRSSTGSGSRPLLRSTGSRSSPGDTGEQRPSPRTEAPPRARGWVRYVQAVAAELADAGRPAIGLTGTISSDLPAGTGLSSSAALEVALALALARSPTSSSSRSSSPSSVSGRSCGPWAFLRRPRPGCVPARVRRARDPARLRLARPPADPSSARPRAPDRRLRRAAEPREHGLRRAAKRARARAATRRRYTLHRPRDHCARRSGGHPDAAAAARRRRERARATVRGCPRGGDLVTAGALVSESHASLRDDYEVSIPSSTSSSWPPTQAPSAHASSAGGSAARCSSSPTSRTRSRSATRSRLGTAGAREREAAPSSCVPRAARPAAGPASAAGAGRPARARTRTGRAGISAAKERLTG